MKKTCVVIESRHLKFLEAKAKAQGTSVSHMLRQLLSAVMELDSQLKSRVAGQAAEEN